MILRYCMENGEVLGAEFQDGYWPFVMSHDHSSQAELTCIVDCNLEGRDRSAREKKGPSRNTVDRGKEVVPLTLRLLKAP
jgi:hypothetical protein